MMKKKISAIILSVTMLFSVSAPLGSIATASAEILNMGETVENPTIMPTITPPANTHPRVMFTEDDLTNIRDYYWNHEQNSEAVAYFERLLASSLDVSASIDTAEKGKRRYLDRIQARAFDYALNKNSKDSAIKERAILNGQNAVLAMMNFLSKVTYESGENDVSRNSGYAAFIASEVYDWCYDIMDDNQRSTIITNCEKNLFRLYSFEITYPDEGLNNITGHAGEYMLFRDLLAFGIAIYDEKPEVYNRVMSRIEHKMVPARKWFYESGAPYQGDMYGFFRYIGEIYAEILVQKMSGGTQSLFTDATHQGFKELLMHWLYMHRPDGRMFIRADDSSGAWGVSGYNTYHHVANFFAGNLFGNKFLKGESFRLDREFYSDKYNTHEGLNAVTWIIMNNPEIDATQIRTELPENKYFGSPAGEIVAKTNWNYGVRNSSNDYLSNDAVSAYMRIGEYYGGNHDALDSGSFQLYYKGILASSSGFYDAYSSEHNKNYSKRTISSNALTISGNDPSISNNKGSFFGSITPANDGGQKIANPEINDLATWQAVNGDYKRATVIDHYVSDTFSYIKGDLTPAYASSKLDLSVPVVRNMAFIETDDENVPAFMIIYDKLKGKSSSNVPQFNLHTQTEPTISGATTTVVTDGGKMTVKTLLPASANITKLGGTGKQYMSGGQNYEPSTVGQLKEAGWGRIEITPTNAATTTEFLNVLAVSDAGYTGTISAETITGSNVTGAKVLNQVVLFSQSKNRVAEETTFTIEGSDTALDIKILGIEPGCWQISKDRKVIGVYQSTMDIDGNGATLSYEGDAGSYELSYMKPSNYSVTLNTNGGVINSGNVAEYEEGISVALPTNVTRVGYKFLGWYDNTELTGEVVTSIPITATGDLTYYAKWEKIPSISDNIEWEKIYEETMEETVYDCATGTVNEYFTMSDADYCYVTNAQATGYTKSAASEFAVPSLKVSAQKNNTRYANLIVEESPLYGNPRNTKVRIEFDFATDKAKGFYIILVGEKDGEVVQTTAGDSGRFIFTSGGELNYETKTAAILTETWYKMAIDLDCASQTYDVYLNGELSSQGEKFPMAMDKIYGVSFAARSFSSTSSNTYYRVQNYIDNLRYYTLKLDDAIPTYSVTLNANGGTIVSGDVTSYQEGIGATLPTDVIKEGCIFLGWYENADFEGEAMTEILADATGNKIYYAKWELLPEGLAIDNLQASYINGEFSVNADVTGYTSLKTGVKFVIAIYDENDSPIGFRFVDYKAGENLSLQEENKDLEKASYVKLFAWNTAILKPLGGFMKAELSFDS